MKVEVAVLGSPSLSVLMISVDTELEQFAARHTRCPCVHSSGYSSQRPEVTRTKMEDRKVDSNNSPRFQDRGGEIRHSRPPFLATKVLPGRNTSRHFPTAPNVSLMIRVPRHFISRRGPGHRSS